MQHFILFLVCGYVISLQNTVIQSPIIIIGEWSRRSDCVSLPNNVVEMALKRQSPFDLLLSVASRLSASVTSSGISEVPSSS